MRRTRIGPAIGLCLLLVPAAASTQAAAQPAGQPAGQPAALVLDVSGSVAPPVGAFDEVDAGTRLALDPGATVMIEHYASCEAVTLRGGAISVGADGFGIDGGEVIDRRSVDCATVVAVVGDTVNAGVILRGVAGPAAPVALAPTIMIAGDTTGVDRLRIERGGREIATLPVRSGLVDWPDGGLFLSDGAQYRLMLLGGPARLSVDIVAGRDGPERVVLRFSAD